MKAVLLDVYETLLTGRRLANPNDRLAEVAERFGLAANGTLHDQLNGIIRKHHEQSPHPYPEVDIRKCWQQIFPPLEELDGFALASENAIHPVTAMPGAQETIKRFHRQGLALGLVSNAQAYTHSLIKEHLSEVCDCFEPSLCSFSYTAGLAKPDTRLFLPVLMQLRKRGIEAHEVLMIGDSFRNDIAPARALGTQTHHLRYWEEFS